MTVSFEVNRSDYSSTRVVESDDTITAGQVRARIDHFAFTSNNITYATIGEALGYWNFFPAESGWGRVPAFGFAEIEASLCDDVAVGSRVYGYWPMASHVVMLPGQAGPRGFSDISRHRQPMADVYNSYTYTHADSIHRADREAQQMLLHPLFFTGFVVDDLLADNNMFDAAAVVLSSASSKTAIATAHLLSAHDGLEVIALTSGRNLDFVTGLGCYDKVLTYETFDELESVPTVYADFSGSPSVRESVHRHLGESLRYSSLIGGTHWDHIGGSIQTDPVPGPEPQFFFAPTQIAKRTSDWGSKELEKRMHEAWDRFSNWTDSWLQIERHEGTDQLGELWPEMLEGRSRPEVGHVVSLCNS